MLFIESRTSEDHVNDDERIRILENLHERGYVPLIRSSRLHCFEQALKASAEQAKELEALVADRADTDEVAYVRGDVFCFEQYALFLIFGEANEDGSGIRAGVIYTPKAANATETLDFFCRDIKEILETPAQPKNSNSNGSLGKILTWRVPDVSSTDSRVEVSSPTMESSAETRPAKVTEVAERAVAAELLEDPAARAFIHRLVEIYDEGELADKSVGDSANVEQKSLIDQLEKASLVRREIQLTCRKTDRSLFRLPSQDALAIVTSSNAVCSDCGAAVADERAEERITATPLAAALLTDGVWLERNLRSMLEEVGFPESILRSHPTTPEGDVQITTPVCGESFLFFACEGNVTAAHARRALETLAAVEATHLAIITTGKVQEDARTRLREYVRRRTRASGDGELVLAEGMGPAGIELRHAVDRVIRRGLARLLYELDANAGFSVGYMLAARFRMLGDSGRLENLAASAAGALASSLRDI